MRQFPFRNNTLLGRAKWLALPFVLVGFMAVISKPVPQDSRWPTRMDQYIKDHFQEAMFHVCFQSIDHSFTQYYRNANLPIPSIDVIKLPIVYEVLWQVRKKELDLKQTAVITPEHVRQNKEGFFGPEDVGKTFTLEEVVEAALTFNDNAAANILLETVGYQNIVDRLRAKDLSNTYLKHPLVDSLKNEHRGITNFVTAGDMMNLMKRIRSEQKFKQKEWLIGQMKQNAQKNGTFGMSGAMVAGMSENSRLAKGFIALVEDKDNGSYYVSMFVSNFKSVGEGDRLLRDIVHIFNGGAIGSEPEKIVDTGGR